MDFKNTLITRLQHWRLPLPGQVSVFATRQPGQASEEENAKMSSNMP